MQQSQDLHLWSFYLNVCGHDKGGGWSIYLNVCGHDKGGGGSLDLRLLTEYALVAGGGLLVPGLPGTKAHRLSLISLSLLTGKLFLRRR